PPPTSTSGRLRPTSRRPKARRSLGRADRPAAARSAPASGDGRCAAPAARRPRSPPLQTAEEWPDLKPPGGGALCQLWQPLLRQPDVLLDVRHHGRLLAGREQFLDVRLLCANGLGEEAALGGNVVGYGRANRVRLLVRLEVEPVVRYGPPDAHRLVRLAGVGG